MGKRVLVAESDNTVQQVVSYFLNLEGFDVTMAGDGVAALEMVETSRPDVILLDPVLPGITGIEVSRLVREKPQFRDTPMLFLADMNGIKSVPEGYGVILKPIDPTKMVDVIKEYMEKGQPPAETRSESAEKGKSASGESISIEELLGWDVSEDSPKEAVGAQGELRDVMDLSSELFSAKESEERNPDVAAGFSLRPEPETVGHVSEMGHPSFAAEETATGAAEKEATGNPGGVEADFRGRITDEMVEDIVGRIAREVIERVAWDIVPKVAEEEIKKEIERIKGESG